MDRQKYLVRVVRPVFQVAYVESEGRNENEAACNALVSAYQIPDEQWSGRFNPDDYIFDVNCVHSGETPEGHAYSLLDFPLYCILSSHETPIIGNSATQPWMNEVQPMTIATLFTQWINKLITERVGYYEEAIDFFEDLLKDWKGTDQKVVPLMPPEERRFDIEIAETAINCIRLLKEVD
jgi:hypothetical protein